MTILVARHNWGHASLHAPLWAPFSPIAHATRVEKEGERGGLGGEETSVCVMCVCVALPTSCTLTSSPYMASYTFCFGVGIGRFLALPGTACFSGTISTPEEKVGEEEDEKREELLPCSVDMELSLPLDKTSFAKDPHSAELASSSALHSQSD